MNHSVESLSEQEIISKVLDGEKRFYEIIIRRYNPYLYKVGRSYNYNHEDTQDMMQDTYIDAYKNLAQFENKSNFKTWLIRIMLNNCSRKKEKFSYKNEFAMENVNEHAQPVFNGSDNNTGKQILNRELGSVLEEAVANIPEDYRIVFSLRKMNGLSVSETANILAISEANVKVRLNRAKAMLRTELEKSYTQEELFEFNLKYCNPFTERVMDIINKL